MKRRFKAEVLMRRPHVQFLRSSTVLPVIL